MDGDYNRGIKRDSDDLLTQSSTPNNYLDENPQPTYDSDSNNDAKKLKLAENHTNKRSRVIHIGGLPNEITETEIIHLGKPFGHVTNILVLKGKNQAFLEMTDEAAAATMVNYFANSPAQLRGKNVYIQYSNHKELKTDTPRFINNDLNKGSGLFHNAIPRAANDMNRTETQCEPNTILRVIVQHMLHSVTLDVLHEIFSRVGKVLKIITFTKNDTFQALIQYANAATAQAAKEALDGQNIYNACCTLRIENSKLNNLSVRYNNDKSRDFTNPKLPTGDGFGAPGIMNSPHSDMYDFGKPRSSFDSYDFGKPLTSYSYDFGKSHTSYDSYDFGKSHTSYDSYDFGKSQNSYDSTILGDGPLRGFNIPGSEMKYSDSSTGSVLLVSNLNEEVITPYDLFILFGVYGDVHRVKILYNKKDNALIQMAKPQQAQLSKTHLDRVKVYGRPIRVAHSKHQHIQMPREGQDDPTMTKDYTNSQLHRFRTPGSKNAQNIFPPSATLHLSNISPKVSEDDIKKAFKTNTGGNVEAFRFFPKDHKMALIEMGSVEEAIVALIKMHSYPLEGDAPLRVSFSKSII